MTYIIIKCVEDECSADIKFLGFTDTPPAWFNSIEWEHLNLMDGTKYATKRINNRTVRFILKPVSNNVGHHILTIQKWDKQRP